MAICLEIITHSHVRLSNVHSSFQEDTLQQEPLYQIYQKHRQGITSSKNTVIQRINLFCGNQRNCDVSTLLTPSLHSWILASARLRSIKEFNLDVSGVRISSFPNPILRCSSLVKLELKLGQNSNIFVLPNSMDLPRLTHLKIDSIPIDGSGRLAEDIHKHGMFLRALSEVRELRLSEWFLHLSLRGFFAFRPLVRFVNLRSIKLEMNLSPWSVKKLGWLLHISPYIKSLSIVIAPGPGMPRTITPDSEWARVSWLPRNLYHLRSVKIRGILGNISQLKLVELIFKYAVALQEMDLYSWKKSTTEEQLIAFGEKLRTLPIASSKISTFFL
ncbi:uncharacterized protein LOC113361111 [Papaver somniferum]|uniref:uncharacterized protein LOC113361111 n=1 Tax=Papaver somniferum TaxID=3469 RepID=UPI000E6F5A4E|nr:uncharacterized protein LOC113361111 [Papaver somniferum]